MGQPKERNRSVHDQLDDLERSWNREISRNASQEYREVVDAYREALDARSQQIGRFLAEKQLLGDIQNKIGEASVEVGPSESIVKPELLDAVVGKIEDPSFKKAIEATGRFLLKLQTQTSAPDITRKAKVESAYSRALGKR